MDRTAVKFKRIVPGVIERRFWDNETRMEGNRKTLSPGTTLGNFEITALLGRGGMGEVYLARDAKLGREVAIKVLPGEFSRDRDRVLRFEREARLLAALNHANIAVLHGLESVEDTHFLVMELVPGQTLADRIQAGPMPLGEILAAFVQIAAGLEAAHEQGIVHRDLKPANIKIADDGRVKILDFGLSKASATAAPVSAEAETSPVGAPQSPQENGEITRNGLVLGTPAYMSPEQARGKPVDRRTDIWAFGCCLYEALAGARPFEGETASDTLAKILEVDPDWEALPAATPRGVRVLLRRCLEKDVLNWFEALEAGAPAGGTQ
jgi:serine/threonine protein kinase